MLPLAAYLANMLGIGLNVLAAFLLMKYAPDSKSVGGWSGTQGFEMQFIPEFNRFLLKAQCSIILLLAGFGLQFLGALLQVIGR
jgi:hypothetical protein